MKLSSDKKHYHQLAPQLKDAGSSPLCDGWRLLGGDRQFITWIDDGCRRYETALKAHDDVVNLVGLRHHVLNQRVILTHITAQQRRRVERIGVTIWEGA